jgi:hypothetical protein
VINKIHVSNDTQIETFRRNEIMKMYVSSLLFILTLAACEGGSKLVVEGGVAPVTSAAVVPVALEAAVPVVPSVSAAPSASVAPVVVVDAGLIVVDAAKK